jgi:hypothetical protein
LSKGERRSHPGRRLLSNYLSFRRDGRSPACSIGTREHRTETGLAPGSRGEAAALG